MANERTDKLQIRLPKDVKDRAQQIAESQNKTLTDLVRAGIASEIEKAKKK